MEPRASLSGINRASCILYPKGQLRLLAHSGAPEGGFWMALRWGYIAVCKLHKLSSYESPGENSSFHLNRAWDPGQGVWLRSLCDINDTNDIRRQLCIWTYKLSQPEKMCTLLKRKTVRLTLKSWMGFWTQQRAEVKGQTNGPNLENTNVAAGKEKEATPYLRQVQLGTGRKTGARVINKLEKDEWGRLDSVKPQNLGRLHQLASSFWRPEDSHWTGQEES